jgi:hypothetical protein
MNVSDERVDELFGRDEQDGPGGGGHCHGSTGEVSPRTGAWRNALERRGDLFLIREGRSVLPVRPRASFRSGTGTRRTNADSACRTIRPISGPATSQEVTDGLPPTYDRPVLSDSESTAEVGSGGDAAGLISRFRRYPKLLSWLLLHVAELPALPGVIVTRWDGTAAARVERFTARWATRSLLMRSDSAAETGRAPRGGFLVAAADAEREAGALLAQDRVVFFLEPASPFSDLYSANLEPDTAWSDWLIEVVGPGFDASDLKRGDVTPHERLQVALGAGGLSVRNRDLASGGVIAAGRTIRLDKIARMLDVDPAEVEPTLRRRGEVLPVDEQGYRRLPDALLAHALETAVQLRPALAEHALSDERVMLSLSFLAPRARLVFWDVVWPDAKYVVANSDSDVG